LTIGPSVSRDRWQSELRICKECFENRVRDASLETAHRLSARFALRQLLTEVDSAAGIAASLADRDHVHDLVEAAVAGEREPVPDHLPAGGLDGSHARVGGEVRFARKPSHVAHHADDLRGQDGTHAEDLGEGGARGLHLLPDALVQIGDPLVEGANVTHYLGGHSLSGSRWFVPWSDSPQQPGGGIGAELLADGVAEKVPHSSTCKRFRARVRSATRSISASP
jgi:hypothetical protein